MRDATHEQQQDGSIDRHTWKGLAGQREESAYPADQQDGFEGE